MDRDDLINRLSLIRMYFAGEDQKVGMGRRDPKWTDRLSGWSVEVRIVRAVLEIDQILAALREEPESNA